MVHVHVIKDSWVIFVKQSNVKMDVQVMVTVLMVNVHVKMDLMEMTVVVFLL